MLSKILFYLSLLALPLLGEGAIPNTPDNSNFSPKSTQKEDILSIEMNRSSSTMLNKSKKEINSSVINNFKDPQSWNKNGGFLCGALLIQGVRQTNISAELTNVDFFNGIYTCELTNASGEVQTATGLMKSTSSILDYAYDSNQHSSSKYSYINLEDTTRKNSVSLRASKMGLWHGDKLIDGEANPYNKKNESSPDRISFMRVLTGMATLNSSFIDGVSASGEIVYSKHTRDSISQVNNQQSADGITEDIRISERKWESFKSYFGQGDSSSALDVEHSSSITFLDYFDKHILAYYFNLDKFAFSQAFEKASMILLSLISGYLFIVLGSLALSKKVEGRNFEFTYTQQALSFGVIFLLTFIPFGGNSNNRNSDATQTTIDSSTTVAKEIIGLFGDYGTRLADIIADNGTVAYLTYVGSKVGENGYTALEARNKALSFKISMYETQKGFYRSHCKQAYTDLLKSTNKSDEYSAWFPSDEWKTNKADYIFEKGAFVTARVSPVYCLHLKNEVIRLQTDINKEHKRLDKSIDSHNEGDYTKFDYLVDAQLIAIKNYGFLATAGIPILHLFSKYNEAFSTESEDDKKKEELLIYAKEIVASNIKNDVPSVGIINEGKEALAEGTSFFASDTVYFMMPMFGEVFKASQQVVEAGGGVAESLVDLFAIVLTRGKSARTSKGAGFLKRSMTTVSNWLKSKNGKTSIKDKKKIITESNNITSSVKGGLWSSAKFYLALQLAIVLYMFLLNVILITIISLFIVAKIIFWFIEIVKYRYVTSFVVFWAITVNQNSSKISEYLLRGVILLIAKPILIVMSILLFVFTYELMNSIYFLIIDYFYIMLSNSKFLGGGVFLGTLMIETIQNASTVFIHLFGIYLAYIIILEGDTWFLKQIGHNDGAGETGTKPLSDKIEKTVGKI